MTWTGEKDPLQTCYKYGSGGGDEKYCWSNSYEHNDAFYQCIPNGVDWHSIDNMTLRKATDTKCETPCQDLFTKHAYSEMCPPINSTDLFNPLKLVNPYMVKDNPFQTCYKYGSGDKYCWTNSFLHSYFHRYFACIPVPEEGCGPSCERYNSWSFANPDTNHECGEPCQHMFQSV